MSPDPQPSSREASFQAYNQTQSRKMGERQKVFSFKTMLSPPLSAKTLFEVLHIQIRVVPICLCISRSMHVTGRNPCISRLTDSDHCYMFQDSIMVKRGCFTDCHLKWITVTWQPLFFIFFKTLFSFLKLLNAKLTSLWASHWILEHKSV